MNTQKTIGANTLKTAIPRLFGVVIHVSNLEEAENFYSTLLAIKEGFYSGTPLLCSRKS
jgi:hypothetical protein